MHSSKIAFGCLDLAYASSESFNFRFSLHFCIILLRTKHWQTFSLGRKSIFAANHPCFNIKTKSGRKGENWIWQISSFVFWFTFVSDSPHPRVSCRHTCKHQRLDCLENEDCLLKVQNHFFSSAEITWSYSNVVSKCN